MVVGELVNMLVKTDRAGLAIMGAAMHRPITIDAVKATKKKKKSTEGESNIINESRFDGKRKKVKRESISMSSSSSSNCNDQNLLKNKDKDKSIWGAKSNNTQPTSKDG